MTGCYTKPVKKEGTALKFQPVKADDPAFLKANFGERTAPQTTDATPSADTSSGTPASPAAVGAATGEV